MDFLDDLKDALLGNERRTELQQFASREGFVYRGTLRYADWDFELKQLEIFRTKKRKRFKNVLQKGKTDTGEWERLFDYLQFEGPAPDAMTLYYLHSEGFGFPPFQIKYRSGLSRSWQHLRKGRGILDAFPTFHQFYRLESDFPTALRPFLNRPTLLRRIAVEKKLRIEGQDQHLLLYYPKKVIELPDLPNFLALGRAVGEALKKASEGDLV